MVKHDSFLYALYSLSLSLSRKVGIAVGSEGHVYVTDFEHFEISRIDGKTRKFVPSLAF